MGFQISVCKFPKNSLKERLLVGKAVTLWDELTEHKEVSQRASFQVLSEDISLFTIALHVLPNITFKFHRNSLRERFSGESCKSLRWTRRSQRSFSESFFLILTGGCFLWPYNLKGDPKYQFSDSTEIMLEVEVTHHKAVSQKVSFQFSSQDIFFFTIGLYGISNIPLQIP